LLALLLQAIYGLRSQRLLLEQLSDNLLYRWGAGLGVDDPVGHNSTFIQNRERLLNEKLVFPFLETLLGMEEVKPLLSNDHFSVDATLLQAWASHGSLQPVDGQHEARQDASTPPFAPLSGLARVWARQIRMQKGGRRRVRGESSMGSASAT